MAKNKMGIGINWSSQQGQRTDDNRDHCGIGLRDKSSLCVVLDGSTSRANSGKFVRLIARDLIDWFVSVEEPITVDILISQLRQIHKERSPNFQSSSASYVIALLENEKPTLILHAGDCLAGRHDEGTSVNWLTRPHTLANAITDMPIADIAASPLRNRLTRSFRARQFMRPDVVEASIEGEQTFILATDGFWAGLVPDDHARFLSGKHILTKDNKDDCSTLVIRTHGATKGATFIGTHSDNLYIATSEQR